MIVYLPRWSRYGTFAAFTTLALSACTKPDEYSDLRPDGPPEVLTVSVNALDTRPTSGGNGATVEQATFCKTQGPNDGAQGAGDPKRPDQANTIDLVPLIICPEDLTKGVDERTDAMPEAWYVRFQFDELLDPSIEDLVANVDAMGMPDGTYTGTLKNTQPVTLQCASSTGAGAMVDVPYDGYYSPSGNSISYPLGPSIVVIPADPTVVATATECIATLKANIKDKDGNQVPADQRGPYKFRTGAITVVAIDPTTDDSKQDAIAAGVDITFNAAVDPASLSGDSTATPPIPAAFSFTPAVPNPYAAEEVPEEYFFGGDFPVNGGPYTFALLAGSKLVDVCGKSTTLGAPSVADLTQTSLTTNPLKLTGITGATEPGNKITIVFNQYMNLSSLPTTEYTLVDGAGAAVTNGAEYDVTGGKLVINADYKLGTAYTFTLKSGSTITDCPGEEGFINGDDTVCVTSPMGGTYTAAMDQVVTFTTASAIVLKSATPADNSTAAAASTPGITLTFNQEIDPTTLVQDVDYTITPNVTMKPTSNRGRTGAGSYEQLRIAPVAPFPPGTYTFTLKGTASVSDLSGGTYTQGTDKVIHFTVTPNDTTAHVCL
jgi:hypothetical protein